MNDKTIKISVRELVEFICRSGNIDTVYMSSKRAVEGTEIHKKIQKLREKESKLLGKIYEKEYSLKYSLEFKDFTFMFEGRADGIIFEKIKDFNSAEIEEIKSTALELENINYKKKHWHMAQLKCYGYFFAKLNNLNEIKLVLTMTIGKTPALNLSSVFSPVPHRTDTFQRMRRSILICEEIPF